ncbi:hypothetical protein CK203_059011 [Vitis vinifera]|uniref:Copia protein n=1 Tax=Vitis vinifera TaxID=29760 RepID=A0A438GEM3_VITVI|nr:hypothetical protein CK203_059011 [Vitis vinifera]
MVTLPLTLSVETFIGLRGVLPFKGTFPIGGDSNFSKINFSQIKSESRRSSGGAREKCGSTLLLQDLGYLSRQPIRLFCDNKATCDIAHNPIQDDRTKHVDVDKFFIKEKLDDKIVELPKIRSEDQLTDILTKAAVSSRVFSKFLDKLGMCDIYAPT